jgi:hypothetical protein
LTFDLLNPKLIKISFIPRAVHMVTLDERDKTLEPGNWALKCGGTITL